MHEGFEVILGTHQAFKDVDAFPVDCDIEPVFRHTTYNHYSVFSPKDAGIPDASAKKRIGVLKSIRQWFRQRNQEHGSRHIIHSFVEDFRLLFDKYPHRPGDQVFLATLGDLELHALAEYASHVPTARVATWHLQFHFNLFQGRPYEYESQLARLITCRDWVRSAFNTLRTFPIYYYNTSNELAEQYKQLGLADFQPLVYPINPDLQAKFHSREFSSSDLTNSKSSGERSSGSTPNQKPLRVTLAGAVRPEKGQEQLKSMVQAINEPLLQTGKMQLVIQRKRRSRYRRQQVDLTDVLGPSMSTTDAKPIEYVEHPLDEQAYESLLKKADVGLFLYDGRTYYARRAGVLGEFLSLGVPVVVPAACWLSEQFRVTNEEYLSELFDSHDKLIPCCEAQSLRDRNNFDLKPRQKYLLRFEGTPRAKRLIIRFRSAVNQGGTGFVRFELASTPVTSDHIPMVPNAGIAPTGGMSRETNCGSLEDVSLDSFLMLPMPVSLGHTLEISAAYDDPRILLDQIEFAVVDESQPLGVVGLVAADSSQVPYLLQELEVHYRHYQQSAIQFSAKWYQTHDSTQVVRQLISRSQEGHRRAA